MFVLGGLGLWKSSQQCSRMQCSPVEQVSVRRPPFIRCECDRYVHFLHISRLLCVSVHTRLRSVYVVLLVSRLKGGAALVLQGQAIAWLSGARGRWVCPSFWTEQSIVAFVEQGRPLQSVVGRTKQRSIEMDKLFWHSLLDVLFSFHSCLDDGNFTLGAGPY